MNFRDFNLRLTKKTELSPNKEKKRKEKLFKKKIPKRSTPLFLSLFISHVLDTLLREDKQGQV